MSLRSLKSLLLSIQPCQMLKSSLGQDSQLRLLLIKKMFSNSRHGVEIKTDSTKLIIMLTLIMVYIINSCTVVRVRRMVRTNRTMPMIMKSTCCPETHQEKILMIFKDKKKSSKETSNVLKRVKRKKQI